VALVQVSSKYFGFPCQFSFHRLPHTHHLSSGAGTIGQLVADVPSGLSHTPHQETKLTKFLLGFRILVWGNISPPFHCVQTGFGDHQPPIQWEPDTLSREYASRGVKLNSRTNLLCYLTTFSVTCLYILKSMDGR
jgi:hypothetical protein